MANNPKYKSAIIVWINSSFFLFTQNLKMRTYQKTAFLKKKKITHTLHFLQLCTAYNMKLYQDIKKQDSIF